MPIRAVILDCYTVEPSGLGVPPYLSAYVRQAYAALGSAHPGSSTSYLTIDDVRWAWNGGRPHRAPPLTDPLTCSRTGDHRDALRMLAEADTIVVVAGDTVPSVHLHAQNGSPDEIREAMKGVAGRRVLLGPLASATAREHRGIAGTFDAVHTHTITSSDIARSSRSPAPYESLASDRKEFDGLIAQIPWAVMAEVELYRGCTRRRFCSFCNEPLKNPHVIFRDPNEVRSEICLLYRAGVRHFRLGQQTCFFSYLGRDVARIEGLLMGIRADCPDLEVLHIDNADPLAVAAPSGARTAALVAEYCTDGNCAPMGIESFDPEVVAHNALTCTPEVLRRAVAHINEVGAVTGPHGVPRLLPGLNLVYGLPGETRRTHAENVGWLSRLLAEGFLCHRTNVRLAQVVPDTPLSREAPGSSAPSVSGFDAQKAEIAESFDVPMKRRVYPMGRLLRDLRPFFTSERGTWYRRLGSYPIQVVEAGVVDAVGGAADLEVTEHAGRYLYGRRRCAPAR